MTQPHILSLPDIGSEDIGRLVVAEGANLPFAIKRAYWTFDVPSDKIRGHHAHYELQQLIIALHGTLEMTVETPDRVRHTFLLDHPSKVLYIPRMCWREIKFGHGAVLLCLASMEYEEADYIRSYYEYVKLVENTTV
ncbi:sugar 3,4-ketoisomerase [Hymenobacter lucidus]|uniref:FdtA/QdtA family cupin domain-containing protein n=1 Tax=Hymenobacter lucidus TaxID=2880930 RepID=A0ABS8AQL7_9BACT|nr:FdtA/QdtA family cupin domain-containing protein [Hymenobacter lucidus]MCB2408507.1 FdtA/QdtA family cupin domain-containing protein [Hymenobacter lucidus]